MAHNQLLHEIHRGVKLRKVRTNDRSKPCFKALGRYLYVVNYVSIQHNYLFKLQYYIMKQVSCRKISMQLLIFHKGAELQLHNSISLSIYPY